MKYKVKTFIEEEISILEANSYKKEYIRIRVKGTDITEKFGYSLYFNSYIPRVMWVLKWRCYINEQPPICYFNELRK